MSGALTILDIVGIMQVRSKKARYENRS